MLDLSKAPCRGTVYAVFADEIVYKRYEKKEDLEEKLKKSGLLELHLFDKNQEYRYIKARRGEIEEIISDESVSHDDCYVEEVYVLGRNADRQDDLGKKAGIVNYLTYDENDLLMICGYRMKEVE